MKKLNAKQKKIFTILAIVAGLAVFGLLTYFIGGPIIRFAKEPELFRAWVNESRLLAALGFMGMVFLQITIAFIPGEPLEIVAGYAFGVIDGTMLCLIGSTIAGMTIFFAARKIGPKILNVFFTKEKIDEIKFLKTNPKRDIIYFIIFLIPATPKDILSYFAGITDMSPLVWLLITSVGRIPSIITSTITGGALGNQNYKVAIISFAATLALVGAGFLIYNKIKKKHNAKLQSDDEISDNNTDEGSQSK